ncbi:MAG: DUF2341 domain-containing protein [Pirellulaceae bacterium]|nr:DUF2341 domain-containing protein [Pirellulaceae bacterium]
MIRKHWKTLLGLITVLRCWWRTRLSGQVRRRPMDVAILEERILYSATPLPIDIVAAAAELNAQPVDSWADPLGDNFDYLPEALFAPEEIAATASLGIEETTVSPDGLAEALHNADPLSEDELDANSVTPSSSDIYPVDTPATEPHQLDEAFIDTCLIEQQRLIDELQNDAAILEKAWEPADGTTLGGNWVLAYASETLVTASAVATANRLECMLTQPEVYDVDRPITEQQTSQTAATCDIHILNRVDEGIAQITRLLEELTQSDVSLTSGGEILLCGLSVVPSPGGDDALQSLASFTAADMLASRESAECRFQVCNSGIEALSAGVENALMFSNSGTREPVGISAPWTQILTTASEVAVVVERIELVFLDQGVADYQQLLNDLQNQAGAGTRLEVVLLGADTDGLLTINAYLQQTEQRFDAVHFITHGTDRAVKFGDTWFDLSAVTAREDEFASWAGSLNERADLLFYGCNLASTDAGRELLTNFRNLTGADIAASVTAIGTESLGGNWLFEFQLGEIETQIAISAAMQAEWHGLLDTFIVTNANDSGAGSLRQVILDANALAGHDAIRFAIAGDGLHTIHLLEALPEITDAITIDGYSQPIVIDGSGTSAGSGLVLAEGSDGSWIIGLGITGFADAGLEINSHSTVLVGNHLWGNEASQLRIASTASDASLYANLIGSQAEVFWNSVGAESTEAQWHFTAQTALNPYQPALDQLQAKDVVLIDLQLEDSETLIRAVRQHALVFVYNSQSQSAADILNQVGNWAVQSESQIETFSILSHGVAGAFQLGSNWITADNLTDYQASLQVLGKSFSSDTKIYLLGCDVTGDLAGQLLVEQLAEITSAQVFASNNVTGADGDWILEYASTGAILSAAQGFTAVFDMEELYSAEVSLAWYNANWQYRQTVTVSAALLDGSTNASNFTILIDVTQASLRSTANGGNVGQADGGDILFTLSDGTTKLSHEIESYDAATGRIKAWVNVPTLSALSTTSLYVYYGNAAAANQWNDSGTWNSTYGGVWHLSNGSFGDSTANANNGTNVGSTNATGIIEDGRSFNGSNQNITVSDANSLDETQTFTISAWVRPTVNDSSWRTIVSKGPADNAWHYWFGIRNAQLEVYLVGTQYKSNYALTLNTWSHVAMTFDNATDTIVVYVNGSAVYTTTSASANPSANSSPLYIGRSVLNNEWWQGSIDEVRFQTTVESANSILAHYRTQSSPGTYTTFTGEVGPPIITSNGGGANAAVQINENSTFVTTVTASDPGSPPQTLTYSISGGADAAKFTIHSSTGVLSFITGPNYEIPTDVGTDNVYNVQVQVSDGALTTTQNIAVTVLDVNEAPTITNGYTYSLTSTNENTTSSGTLASTILAGASHADVDTGAVSGLAITATTGNGTWQYSTDGVTWRAFGAVSNTNALLITSSTQVRYIPDSANGETATFSYRAWDRTTGTASTNATANYGNASSNGGTTAYSANVASASMVVTSVNDAPTLTNGYTYSLTGTNEDTTSSGTLASAILTGASWADVDTGAVSGLAITATTGNGTWQYSTDGVTWRAFGAVSNTNALLITSSTQVRYIPDSANGETATFSYRAWDRTTGTASTNATANYGNASSNGGTTAYSTNVASGSMVVTSVNDAPSANVDTAIAVEAGGISNGSAGINPSGNVLTNDTDPDVGDTQAVIGVAAGIVANTVGSVGANVVGTYGSIIIAANGNFTYTVDNNNSTVQALKSAAETLSDVFTYTMQDSGGLTSTTQITVTIQGANDSPLITSNGGGATANVNVVENNKAVTTVTSADPDDNSPTYSIVGGLDAAKFTINSSTGALAFIVAPDFEAPNDSNQDNVYQVTVQASDGRGGSSTQTISVTVTDAVGTDVIYAFEDTYITSVNTGFNYGQSSSLIVDRSGGSIGNSRILIQFDLSAIPSDATITSATLIMNSTANGGAMNINVYRLTQAWTEGAQSGAAGAASWTQAQAGVNWTLAGGAFNSTVIATLNTGDTGQHSWNITSLVNSWYLGNFANFGLVIGSPDLGTTAITYDSSESGNGPQLLITFDTSNLPPTITSNGGGGSASISVDENQAAVTTVMATDANGDTLTYSIVGGTDGGAFNIHNQTGVLTFVNPPDYEAPTDSNLDNIYEVVVQVSDGQGGLDSQTIYVTVLNINDAPTLTNGYTYSLTGTNEDTTSSGTLASAILTGASWADVDAGAVSGLAITATTGNGTWQYSTDGVTWRAFGAVSNTSALLITSSTQVRYIPDSANGETATFSYRAWDQTTGTASTNATANYGNASSNGGTTAYSANVASASMVVTSVNDAPTLTNGYTYSLTGTNEDTTSSGTFASAILTGASWADVDTGAVSGLAITATTGNGTWQYSTDGVTWRAFGAVSNTNALLITSSTQVRYIPDDNNGETATFSYRAWDQTTGTASTNATANYGNASSNGGTTAYSANVASASMVVTSVNDAPTLTNGYTYSLTGTNEDTTSSGTLASAILTGASWADVDDGAVSGLAITATTGNGTWQYSTDGVTWRAFGAVSNTNALLITSSTQVRYIPDDNNGETATFSYRAWDQTTGTASTNATANYGNASPTAAQRRIRRTSRWPPSWSAMSMMHQFFLSKVATQSAIR